MPAPTTRRINLLFICSRNQWRSPTAEQVWHRHPGVAVRSAGTSASARLRVTESDLLWADHILVMESHHKARLRADFGDALNGKPVHVLDIPDDYPYMHPELVQQLQTSVAALLGLG